jgi:hypothetical protein
MSIPELKPNIQINSFYYCQSHNWFVIVVAIQEDWVYYKHPNCFDIGTQHMIIDEFYKKFERVAFIQKQNENS